MGYDSAELSLSRGCRRRAWWRRPRRRRGVSENKRERDKEMRKRCEKKQIKNHESSGGAMRDDAGQTRSNEPKEMKPAGLYSPTPSFYLPALRLPYLFQLPSPDPPSPSPPSKSLTYKLPYPSSPFGPHSPPFTPSITLSPYHLSSPPTNTTSPRFHSILSAERHDFKLPSAITRIGH